MKTSFLLRSILRPVAALLLTLPAAALDPAPPSPPIAVDPTPSIYNLDSSTGGTVSIGNNQWVAASFIVPGSTYVYNFNSVTLSMGAGQSLDLNINGDYRNSSLYLGLYKNKTGGGIGDQVAGLSSYNNNGYNPSTEGKYAYLPNLEERASDNVFRLTPNATYWVRAQANIWDSGDFDGEPPAAGSFEWKRETSDVNRTVGSSGGGMRRGTGNDDVGTAFTSTFLNMNVKANPVAFWRGDLNGSWTELQNTTNTNFAKNQAGSAGSVDFNIVPDSGTDVEFSATDAENKTTHLGTTSLTINNLVINDGTRNAGVESSTDKNAYGVTLKTNDSGLSQLNLNQLIIARTANASAALSLIGQGLTVANASAITVGEFGAGTLNVLNGAVLQGPLQNNNIYNYYNQGSVIGYQSGSSGTVNVAGVGSEWTGIYDLRLADSANSTGTLNITEGGFVEFNSFVGIGMYGKGTATVSGPGSSLERAETQQNDGGNGIGVGIYNGNAAANASTLSILDGGYVDSYFSGHNQNYALDVIGFSGTGKVTVDGVHQTFDDNLQNPTYQRSEWNAGNLYLGVLRGNNQPNDRVQNAPPSVTTVGTGTLDITNGAQVEAQTLSIGLTGIGVVNVNGSQSFSGGQDLRSKPFISQLYVATDLNVGSSMPLGENRGDNFWFGGYGGGKGTLNVEDGAYVGVGGLVNVGLDGEGLIKVDNSVFRMEMPLPEDFDPEDDSLPDFSLYLGGGSYLLYENQQNTLSVSQQINGNFSQGKGTLTITNEGEFYAGNYVEVGWEGTGVINVEKDSTLVLNKPNFDGDLLGGPTELLVGGYTGNGTLNIKSGGYVEADIVYIGYDNVMASEPVEKTIGPVLTHGTAVVTVDGQGSRLLAKNDLYVGYYSSEEYPEGGKLDGAAGTLNLINGGLAVVGNSVTIGTWDNDEEVFTRDPMGDDTVTDYGTGTLYLGYDDTEDGAPASGILNIGTNNGTAGFLQATLVDTSDGTGTINFNHNSSQGRAPWMEYNTDFNNPVPTISTFQHDEEISFRPYEFDADIAGDITVNHLGTGMTVLRGYNDYKGTTNIKAGILFVGGIQRFDWLYDNYTSNVLPGGPIPMPTLPAYYDADFGSLNGVGDITVGTGTGTPALLAGNGIIDLRESGSSIFVKNGGGISVASYDEDYEGPLDTWATTFRLSTGGELGAARFGPEYEGPRIKMEAGSALFLDIVDFSQEVMPTQLTDEVTALPGRDMTGDQRTADRILLTGLLDATAGGTIVLGNPNELTGFRAGDKWLLVDLNPTPSLSHNNVQQQGITTLDEPEPMPNAGVIEGVQLLDPKDVENTGLTSNQLPVIETALGLNNGNNADNNVYLKGFFDADTGVYELYDWTPQASAQQTGTQTASQQDQSVVSTISNALGDLNGRLYNLRAGGLTGGSGGNGPNNDSASNDDGQGIGGSLYATIDEGVVFGYGDGPEDHKVAKKVLRSYQWEVYTTVSYGNVNLSTIGTQAGVKSQTWSPSVGIERYVTEHLAVGFAVSFMNTHQKYAGGVGDLDMQGLSVSAYASYVRPSFWIDTLYSFGMLDLESTRNPGFAFPVANGETSAFTNAVQLNGGWNFRFQDNTLVTGPFAGLDYMHATVDSYSETGGGLAALAYGQRSFDSLISRIGWSVSKKYTANFATITPQLRLSYERQNMSNNNATSASLINLPFTATTQSQSPGQDYVVLGGGVNFDFTARVNLLLTYQTQLFRENMTAHFASIRLGYKF